MKRKKLTRSADKKVVKSKDYVGKRRASIRVMRAYEQIARGWN